MNKKQFGGVIPYQDLLKLSMCYHSKKAKSSFLYISDIKSTNKHYGLQTNGKKKELEKLLFEYIALHSKVDYIQKYHLETLCKIQRKIREKIRNKNFCRDVQSKKNIRENYFQGPGLFQHEICVNQEDFYTMETFDEIPKHLFFSIEDERKHIFFFDIRSFEKLIEQQINNPYTQLPFTESNIKQYHQRKEYMKTHNILCEEIEDNFNNLTSTQKLNLRIVDITTKINQLNVVAGGFDTTWFQELNYKQLCKYYIELEDIWNWRANLNEAQKLDIIPNKEKCKKLFPYSVHTIKKLKPENMNKETLQYLILSIIDTLISSSNSEEHRINGGYYCLMAFTIISPNIANAIPWLVQSM